jgi:hypothetical protein
MDKYIHLTRFSQFKWEKLYALSLSSEKIGWTGYKNLSKSYMPDLHRVSINLLTNEGLTHLSKAEWPFLNSVNLCSSRLTFAGFSNIMKCNWKML